MRVLLVGGAGEVGRMVLPRLAQEHEAVVFDVQPPAMGGTDYRYVRGSVLEPDDVARAADGCDALIYLAMGHKEDWGGGHEWVTSQFDINVKGAYLTLTAAARSGVKRFVLASSMSVFESFLSLPSGGRGAVPDAVRPYGLTKRLAEQASEAVAIRYNLSVTALRLALPLPDEEWAGAYPDDPALRCISTSAQDVSSAFLAALEHGSDGFAAYTVSGDHEQRVLNWEDTRAELGWEPLARRQITT